MVSKKSVRLFTLVCVGLLSLAFRSSLPEYEGQNITKIDKDQITKISELKKLESSYSTKLGRKYLGEKEYLRDEVIDALGKYRLSGTLLSHKFKLDDYDSQAKLRLSIKPERLVNPVARGTLKEDNSPDTFKTKFEVVDAITISNQLSIFSDVEDDVSVGLFENETAIKVQKISYVDSLEDYLQKDPAQALAPYMLTPEEITQQIQSNEVNNVENKLSTEAYNQYDLEARAQVSNYIEKLTVDERMKIFFSGFFDPFKVGEKYIKISSVELQKSLKPGETLVKTFYKKVGPSASARNGIWRFRVHGYKYQAFSIGFHKDLSGKLYVKTQYSESPTLDIDLSSKFKLISFAPVRFNKKYSKTKTDESLYMFNLDTSFEMDTAFNTNSDFALNQLDRLFNHIGNPLNPKNLANDTLDSIETRPGEVERIFVKRANSLGKDYYSKNRVELGIIGLRSEKLKKCTHTKLEYDSDLPSINEALCNVEKLEKARIRIPKLFNLDQTNEYKFRMLTKKESDGSIDSDIGFEYAFLNSHTAKNAYRRSGQFLKNALFMNEISAGSIIDTLKQFIDDKINSKSKKKNEQAMIAGLYFSHSFVNKILSKNIEDVKTLVAQAFVAPYRADRPVTWNDLIHVSRQSVNGTDCSSAVNEQMREIMLENNKLTCFRIASTARLIVKTFEDAQRKNKFYEVASVFADFVKNKDIQPVVPHLMMQIGLLDRFENGVAIYNDINEVIANNEIEMSVTFFGDETEGVMFQQLGDVPTLKETIAENDFSLNPIAKESSTILSGTIYEGTDKLYLELVSLLQLNSNFNLRAVLYKKNFPVAFIKANEMIPTHSIKDNPTEEFHYFTTLPAYAIPELRKGHKYKLVVYVVDNNETRITEPFEIIFKY